MWICYIDDILVVWKGTESDIYEFIHELNDNTCNIRLMYGFDQVSIPFLDLRITKKSGSLVTSTFRKSTVANTLLGADRYHLVL